MYINLLGNIQTYRLAKEIFKNCRGDGGYFLKEKFALMTDSGEVVANPITMDSYIELKIPVPPDIIIEQSIPEFVIDQRSSFDNLFISTGTKSFVETTSNEMYVNSDYKELVYVCTWKLKSKQLVLSIVLWSVLFLLFGTIFFLILI